MHPKRSGKLDARNSQGGRRTGIARRHRREGAVEDDGLNVTIFGGSGFVGRHLAAALRARGDDVTIVSLRDPAAAARVASKADVVVNLAGAPVASRWTRKQKKEIRRSRVDLTRELLDLLATFARIPRAYVSASAVGYYGTSLTETFVESSPAGDDFLARVCVDWECEANRASLLGMRVAIVRLGVVLGADGGALAKMLPPFRLGMGGRLGSGRQWMSWVHVDDAVGIFLLAIDSERGVMNAAAPEPVTNAEFTQVLASTLRRRAILPVPEFALRLLFGQSAQMLT
ncbi:MAG: TIGR01777 family oxidoreductase, partial [Polyangiaceae bacterium]